MIISPNLGLRIWSSLSDPYSSEQLAENWARVDEHDHTSGKGPIINTGAIADGAITAAKIASGAIPPPPSVANISSSQIADGAITTPKLANGAVSVVKTQTVLSASASRVAVQAVAAYAAASKITFDTIDFDTGSIVNLGLNPTRLTISTSGLYTVSTGCSWQQFSNYFAFSQILKNNIAIGFTDRTLLTNSGYFTSPTTNVSAILRLSAGDYLELQAAQDSYIALNVTRAFMSVGMIGL